MSKGEVFRDLFPYLTGGDSSLVLPLGHLGLHALFAAAAFELHRSAVLHQMPRGVNAPTWDVARLGASEVDWDVDPLGLGSKFHESRLHFSTTETWECAELQCGAVLRNRNV